MDECVTLFASLKWEEFCVNQRMYDLTKCVSLFVSNIVVHKIHFKKLKAMSLSRNHNPISQDDPQTLL